MAMGIRGVNAFIIANHDQRALVNVDQTMKTFYAFMTPEPLFIYHTRTSMDLHMIATPARSERSQGRVELEQPSGKTQVGCFCTNVYDRVRRPLGVRPYYIYAHHAILRRNAEDSRRCRPQDPPICTVFFLERQGCRECRCAVHQSSRPSTRNYPPRRPSASVERCQYEAGMKRSSVIVIRIKTPGNWRQHAEVGVVDVLHKRCSHHSYTTRAKLNIVDSTLWRIFLLREVAVF